MLPFSHLTDEEMKAWEASLVQDQPERDAAETCVAAAYLSCVLVI